jgi:hypothetical protein
MIVDGQPMVRITVKDSEDIILAVVYVSTDKYTMTDWKVRAGVSVKIEKMNGGPLEI